MNLSALTHSSPHLQRLAQICCAIAVFWVALPAMADFTISHGQSRVIDNNLVTQADLNLELGPQTQEALIKGIPLTIIIEFRLSRHRPLIWDRRLREWQKVYELSYHALTGRYTLREKGTANLASFATLSEALDDLGRFRHHWMLDEPLSDAPGKYRMAMRVRLDTNALPAPLRVMSLIRPDWRSSSGWEQWPVK